MHYSGAHCFTENNSFGATGENLQLKIKGLEEQWQENPLSL